MTHFKWVTISLTYNSSRDMARWYIIHRDTMSYLKNIQKSGLNFHQLRLGIFDLFSIRPMESAHGTFKRRLFKIIFACTNAHFGKMTFFAHIESFFLMWSNFALKGSIVTLCDVFSVDDLRFMLSLTEKSNVYFIVMCSFILLTWYTCNFLLALSGVVFWFIT